ncbi:hypothetical protein, partial [Pseudomonas sichuanensis]
LVEVIFEAASFKTPSTSTAYCFPRGVQRCEEANNTRFELRVNTLILKNFWPAPGNYCPPLSLCR